jgi:hypothetical protein
MVKQETRVIALRRSTVIQVVIAVLVALGVGIGIGLVVSSPSPPAKSVVTATTTTSHRSTTTATSPPNTAPTAAPTTTALPAVLSCGPGPTPHVRPTRIYIGCASGDISITTIMWSSWGSTAGSGSGTLNVNNCQPNCSTGRVSSSPAFVVVSNSVGGVFQDVLITPPRGGGLTTQSSTQPGSGWGSG